VSVHQENCLKSADQNGGLQNLSTKNKRIYTVPYKNVLTLTLVALLSETPAKKKKEK
jgi:hypothetical protein